MMQAVAGLHRNEEGKNSATYGVNGGIQTYVELKRQLKYIHGSEKKANQYGNGVYGLLDQLKEALGEIGSNHTDPIRYLSFLYFNPKKELSLRDISEKLKKDFKITISHRTLGQYFTDKFEWEVRGKNTSTKKVVEQNRKTNKRNQEKKQREVQDIIESIKREKVSINTFDIDRYVSIPSKSDQIQYLLESYGYIEKDGLIELIERYQSDNYSDRKITIAIDSIIKNIIRDNELEIQLGFSKHRISQILIK